MTDTKQLVVEYADIEKQIEAFEARKKEIKSTLQEEMTALGADQIKSEVGMFYFRTTKKWKYSERIMEIEKGTEEKIKPLQEEINVHLEFLKNVKEVAQEKGDEATAEEVKSLAFKAEK